MIRCGILVVVVSCLYGCDRPAAPASDSGVKKASVKLKTGSDGLTPEQRNVSERLKNDNIPGAIKHLYVISPYSGQAIIYSTVRGKVTSSGKRLTPTSISSAYTNGPGEVAGWGSGFVQAIGDTWTKTQEVLQDDGTYGSSDPYIYWWDAKGVYHQHFMTGGQIVHVADQPLAIKSVIINIEESSK